MSDRCPATSQPLDAEGLITLAVLMAVHDRALSVPEVACRVARLAAPGLATNSQRVASMLETLHVAGHVEAEGLSDTGAVRWRISASGRELATDLGGRAPGRACDASRTCLLLRLCLEGTMPASNRRVLVASLLGRTGPGGDGQGDFPAND